MTYRTDQLLYWAEQEVATGDLALARAHLRQAATAKLSASQAEQVARLLTQTVPAESEFTERHRAQAGALGIFSDTMLVTCPRCAKPGTVSSGPGHRGGRFTCTGCTYRADGHWLGPGTANGEARCRACGTWITLSRSLPGGERPPVSIRTRCPSCQAANSVKVSLTHADASRSDPPLDPVMGLPLWLATQTRHGWLWALNGEHLDELRHLIAARVRDTPQGNGHWANRLPSWIVAAKNRNEVSRALDRLHAKLP